MGDVHGQAYVCEMESIAEPDQSQCDDMVSNQLFEVLAWLLQLQKQDDSLLCPVAGLDEIITLKQGIVGLVGVSCPVGVRVEVPYCCTAHDVQSKRSKDGKVDRSVRLFHESRLFALRFHTRADGERP